MKIDFKNFADAVFHMRKARLRARSTKDKDDIVEAARLEAAVDLRLGGLGYDLSIKNEPAVPTRKRGKEIFPKVNLFDKNKEESHERGTTGFGD